MNDVYEVFAVKYGQRVGNRGGMLIFGDPHDAPMPMDYYVWAVRNAGRTVGAAARRCHRRAGAASARRGRLAERSSSRREASKLRSSEGARRATRREMLTTS